jgi:hypothetical protein
MVQKNLLKKIILSLIILLLASFTFVQGAPTDNSVPVLEEEYIDRLIEEIQSSEEIERPPVHCVWDVETEGYSWRIETEPSVSDVAPERIPMKMRLKARLVRITSMGRLYKIEGTLTQGCLPFKVWGKAVLLDNRYFVIKLDGEAYLRLYAVGRVYRVGEGLYKVWMRGILDLGKCLFRFVQRGEARRLCLAVASARIK